MKLWPEILENFDVLNFNTDSLNLRKIIQDLSSTGETAQMLLEKSFQALEKLNMLENDESSMMAYCKFTKSMDSVIQLVNQHKDAVKDDWVQRKLLENSCKEFFETKKFPDFVRLVSCASSSTMDVLTALK